MENGNNQNNLSETELAFIALERQKAEHKKFFDELREATQKLVAEKGLGHFFQDDQGIVYKTDECSGKFVYFEPFEVKRTRREGETKGSLSLADAKAAGFQIPGQK